MVSRASIPLRDAAPDNNNSTAIASPTCSGVSADVIREGSTPFVEGASHPFSIVLTSDQTIENQFMWSISSGSNGTIVGFDATGSSCRLDPAATTLTCLRANPLGVGSNKVATVLIRPTTCTQRLVLQPRLDPALPLNAQSMPSRPLAVACGRR